MFVVWRTHGPAFTHVIIATYEHREWLASTSTDSEPSSSHGSLPSPLEVKEIVRQAVEDGIVRRLGFRPDATAGEMRLSLAFLHPAADQADYEGAVKVRV